MFQRGEGPLLVASGFVKDDTAANTMPVLDLLGSRDELGVAARREIEEQVVTVSLLILLYAREWFLERHENH